MSKTETYTLCFTKPQMVLLERALLTFASGLKGEEMIAVASLGETVQNALSNIGPDNAIKNGLTLDLLDVASLTSEIQEARGITVPHNFYIPEEQRDKTRKKVADFFAECKRIAETQGWGERFANVNPAFRVHA